MHGSFPSTAFLLALEVENFPHRTDTCNSGDRSNPAESVNVPSYYLCDYSLHARRIETHLANTNRNDKLLLPPGGGDEYST